MKRLLALITGPAIMVASLIVLTPQIAQADTGAPPNPHGASGDTRCLLCHGPAGVNPAPPTHTAFNESSCSACHPSQTAPKADSPVGQKTESPVSSPNDTCLGCHNQPGLEMTLGDGEKTSVYVDPQEFAGSIHGEKLLCTDCHSAISSYPHPKRETSDKRQYSIAQYELCKKCHFENYTKTLDSVHYVMFSRGNLQAPLCTDCHGAHNVALPSQPRNSISQTCSKCHQSVYEAYSASVHGKALIQQNNNDVPVCTDCHLSHTIEDPRTASFRLGSVELCSSCHSNEKLMQKYGISTRVVETYLDDFHGRTVAMAGKEERAVWVGEAVCTDCHGVHNIQQVDSSSSPVIKANLVATCQKCHPDASTNFPSAWLSHYEPSLTKAPLVFLAEWFYRIMIPFILVGLSIHVLLDLWRTITNR